MQEQPQNVIFNSQWFGGLFFFALKPIFIDNWWNWSRRVCEGDDKYFFNLSEIKRHYSKEKIVK